jgi:hypothetical protein
MKLPALCLLLLLCGCTAFRLESPSLLQGQVEAVAFRGGDQERKEGRNVSVVGLPELLARATWVDGHVFHKGGIWVRFAEGREVFLPYGFDFFVMGDRGYFEIRKEDVPKYREIVQRIQKEMNQAPNP